MRIVAHYEVSSSFEAGAARQMTPKFSLEMDQLIQIDHCFQQAADVCTFLSFCEGLCRYPAEFTIGPSTYAEIEQSGEDECKPHYFQIEQTIAKASPRGGRDLTNWPAAHCGDDDACAAFVSCLQAWLERREQWRSANNMMMGSFAAMTDFGGDRLISALSWLDEIPRAKPLHDEASANLPEIAKAATEKAVQLGLGYLSNRIEGAIKRIREESHQARIERLLQRVKDRFGDILGPHVLPDLLKARELRGRTAHGAYEPQSEQEHRQLAVSTAAVEALCFLLMAHDLPLRVVADPGLDRHRAIRIYRELLR
jgi:hypothetical protein